MEDEELDIPIRNPIKQLELGICMECGKRKAKYLCDYITGKSFDLYGKGKIETSTCDKYLCEKCTNKLNGRDYCKNHIKEIKEDLELYKKFIKKRGLQNEFQSFMIIEMANK